MRSNPKSEIRNSPDINNFTGVGAPTPPPPWTARCCRDSWTAKTQRARRKKTLAPPSIPRGRPFDTSGQA